jgi:hypothetical protein
MGRRPVRATLDRSDQLLGLLRSREVWTAPELAEALDVSLRTIRRDLAALDARGVPLEAERGRGGGVRLAGTYGLGRVQLDEHELLDLVLALALAERLRSPLLLGHARAVRHKLAASFPPEQRRRLERVRRRVLIGEVASPAVRAGSTSRASDPIPITRQRRRRRPIPATIASTATASSNPSGRVAPHAHPPPLPRSSGSGVGDGDGDGDGDGPAPTATENSSAGALSGR